MCGLGVPVGCRMKHAKGLFKRPIRSHWCVASGWLLAAGWSMPSQRFKGFPKHVIFMSKCLEVLTGGRSMRGKCLRDVALGQLAGCEMGLTLESEEGEVPHLRWSQAPPLPWPRPGSADSFILRLSRKLTVALIVLKGQRLPFFWSVLKPLVSIYWSQKTRRWFLQTDWIWLKLRCIQSARFVNLLGFLQSTLVECMEAQAMVCSSTGYAWTPVR